MYLHAAGYFFLTAFGLAVTCALASYICWLSYKKVGSL